MCTFTFTDRCVEHGRGGVIEIERSGIGDLVYCRVIEYITLLYQYICLFESVYRGQSHRVFLI